MVATSKGGVSISRVARTETMNDTAVAGMGITAVVSIKEAAVAGISSIGTMMTGIMVGVMEAEGGTIGVVAVAARIADTTAAINTKPISHGLHPIESLQLVQKRNQLWHVVLVTGPIIFQLPREEAFTS